MIDCNVHVGTADQMLVPWNTVGDPEEILGTRSERCRLTKSCIGSCGPHLDARVAVETIRLLELPPGQEAKVKGGNILSLLKLAG